MSLIIADFRGVTLSMLVCLIFVFGIDLPSALAAEKAAHPTRPEVPVIFGKVKSPNHSNLEFAPGELTLTEKDLGIRTTLFGKLTDTSAINMFHAYWYDGHHIACRRYYVKDRIYKRPHHSVWVTIHATITHIDTRGNDKHEIQIHAYHTLSTKEIQAITHAAVASYQWLSENRRLIDLNQFKQGRAKPYLADEGNWNKDFNKLDRYDNVDIRSLDMKRGVVEFIGSRYVVEEVRNHHAVYIDLIMVYDLKNSEPIRMIVRRGGFFLE